MSVAQLKPAPDEQDPYEQVEVHHLLPSSNERETWEACEIERFVVKRVDNVSEGVLRWI